MTNRFNVLLDPWVPLLVEGRVEHVSYVQLLSGERDAAELESPREDVRFFVRMLLSALTQALLAPVDARELRARIAKPLERRAVEAVIADVQGDFDLVGESAFMQDSPPPAPGKDRQTDRLFLDVPTGTNHTLFRPAHEYVGLCPACAVPALYGLQSFAAAGGRGFSPGVRFRPPVTTLVWQPSLRASIWANVLSRHRAAAVGYASDPPRPWSQAPHTKSGDAIGILEGLFWRPRRLTLEYLDGEGACAVCGRRGRCLAATAFAPGAKVDGGFFRHPFSPSHDEISTEGQRVRRFVHFDTNRPAWMGLAEILPGVRGNGRILAAPVVEQWFEDLDHTDVTLEVLAYASKQAKILGRVCENFSLSMQANTRDVMDDIGFLTERADHVVGEIRKALRLATALRGAGDLWLPDAEAAFWAATEAPFWEAVTTSQRGDDPSAQFLRCLRATGMRIFDEHTAVACLQATKQQPVAVARKRLALTLGRLLTTEGVLDATAEAR